jgi:hypothetical protein
MKKENALESAIQPDLTGSLLLAAVNSVFKRHKPRKRFNEYFFYWKTPLEKYRIAVYGPEKHNYSCIGLHCCRIDTKRDDNVYNVKPENLIKWLTSVKKQLEWKREIHKKQVNCESEEEYCQIDLALFLRSDF